MVSASRSGRKRSFSVCDTPELEDLRPRTIKARRLTINPKASPFISFPSPSVLDSPNFQPEFMLGSSLNASFQSTQPIPHPSHLYPSNLSSLDSQQENLCTSVDVCSHLSRHQRTHPCIRNESISIQGSSQPQRPHRSNARAFLALQEVSPRLSHLEPNLRSHPRLRPTAFDLSQTLGKLCIVDEVDESTLINESDRSQDHQLGSRSQPLILSPTHTVLSSSTDSD